MNSSAPLLDSNDETILTNSRLIWRMLLPGTFLVIVSVFITQYFTYSGFYISFSTFIPLTILFLAFDQYLYKRLKTSILMAGSWIGLTGAFHMFLIALNQMGGRMGVSLLGAFFLAGIGLIAGFLLGSIMGVVLYYCNSPRSLFKKATLLAFASLTVLAIAQLLILYLKS